MGEVREGGVESRSKGHGVPEPHSVAHPEKSDRLLSPWALEKTERDERVST